MSGSHRSGARPESGPRPGISTETPRTRRPRRRRRRLVGVALSLVILLVAGAGWIYLRLNGNIRTFSADGVSPDRPEETGGHNVLVIGSDSRAGGNDAYGGGQGDVGRSDTAFLLHVYADRRHAVAVSIPRDALVEIPPCRLPDGSWTGPRTNTMFNAAFSVGDTTRGNPACTQNTVEKLTGLRVDHTVVIDFAGFAEMTSAVGGVDVCVPTDVYAGDLNPNLHARGELLFAKGRQNVSGRKALDYVRIRHGLGDGSDIGRIRRQQAFVAALITRVKGKGLDPITLFPLADAATKALTVDPGLGSVQKLTSFAMSLRDIDLHNTKFVTVPWRYQGERVAIVRPQADILWSALRADRTVDGEDAGGKSPDPNPGSPPASTAPPPGTGISVAVYNGTPTTGLAARAADTLRANGFTVTTTATAASRTHIATVIEYGRGERDRADTVAHLFPGAELRPTSATGLTVTLGRTFATEPPPPTGSTASTPAPPPASVVDKVRSADDDPCSNLSFG
ncbi:LCP family protein [Embleya hyalina]|uniref:Transcriptional regulator n=1 Tax=Embleya hyalina TaxID=516124 RepID=A0A401YZT4_9ACTN|nr:LCP family protein [Embleya hyalina]GCE00140.1 transcriptional regulator [Embleya hyalina]